MSVHEPAPGAYGRFDLLSPQLALEAVETVYGLTLDGAVTPYPSYVNRVYGVMSDDGRPYIAKFYRPDRWSDDALAEEHEFLADCADADVPVVLPLSDAEGQTLHTLVAESEDEAGETEYRFTLFPKRSGRLFDADRTEDFKRLGSLIGRMHAAARRRNSRHRITCTPGGSTRRFARDLEESGLVAFDGEDDYFDCIDRICDAIEPLFDGIRLQRVHGDCHRGNILDRADEGLMLIDFDDMMMGPAVHDLWLLLPGRVSESRTALDAMLNGYGQFETLDPRELRLVEPLRFMRIIYYTAWCARQIGDARFRATFGDWGSVSFWKQELEDLLDQERVIEEALG
ncbi:MAG: serine/threonine protein kinase [Spirochaetaceae bacterium]